MSAESDRIAALERQVARLAGRVTALESKRPAAEDHTARAQRAHQERLTGRPACPTCDGATVILDDANLAHPCPSCRPQGARR
jgi:hypothetical protein